ncbi:MAG: integrin alpha, partial [Candidatus Poseidoniia archaeon]|nr:integrin alpha [Candidatus Poseidoniia archaeon]
MRNAIASMLVALLLLGAALPLLVLDASGTRWEQTSTADFDDGESFFVDTSGGTLKLSRGLTGIWSDQGETASDFFGRSVASAGDVNGDGYADVIVGAYFNDDGGNAAGEAYVYHGSSSGLSATPDWSDQGEASSDYDYFGYSVASAGDVNGDGYADVIVGAYGNDGAGSAAGEVYVYSFGVNAVLTAWEDWSDQGEAANDYFGVSVASAGDVNGDGYADVIVGAYGNDGADSAAGEAYVYYGSASGLSATPDWSDQGEAEDDYFGFSVASAGDVNGDGYADVVVGALYNDGAGSNAGEAYVYHGSASGLSATPDWSDQGEAASDAFGVSVASAGDVNGDGYADVIVGANGNDGAGSAAGEAYVYSGSGYAESGIFESLAFTLDSTDAVDWLILRWTPSKPQPAGTSVKAQIGTSSDGVTWTWHGPTGSTSNYFTNPAGQAIYSGDRGKFLKVRFYLT